MRTCLTLALVLCHFAMDCRAVERRSDVVIYGGTCAAVTAAVQVKRMGKSVVIVSPDKHLGGLTSGGLGWTDSGNKDAIGGISREFYHRVWKHYQESESWSWQEKSEFGNRNQSPPGKDGDGATMWVFEPHVAEKIFEAFVAEYEIPVYREQYLDRDREDGVQLQGRRIVAIRTLAGDTFRGDMFIDATYEGDLLAKAGCSYHVGRESNATYGETWNGIQVGVLHHSHFFAKPVDPFVEPGNPASGLLKNISNQPPGIKGEGDHRLQAYCFRMCLTDHDANRIPFAKPDGYDASEYELLLRVFDSGWRQMFNKFDPIPNHKTDTNNHGPFSTDYIGMNYDYPEASYEGRREIIATHELYQKGLMYFMANDPRVPEDVRSKVAAWGLAADEFTDNGGWPHQIYVREARRLIGHYVMTEHDCLDQRETPESVGMGSYTLDSHNVQRYVTPEGFVQNEGDIGVKTPRPYEISYGSMVPKSHECENLLVPVCVSSSHIAFGSIRMEPVFMILGQSAATAACLAIDDDQAVQAVEYERLREQLLKDSQVLELDVQFENDARKLGGTVIDDAKAAYTGAWQSSHANRPFVDLGYRHDGNGQAKTEDAASTATFSAELAAGTYDVGLAWPANNNRSSQVAVVVHHRDGVTTLRVDQRKKPSDGLFHLLGVYDFDGPSRVEISNQDSNGYVVVDAVQFKLRESSN